MQELQAVNICLGAAGKGRVNSVSGTDPLVGQVRKILEEERRSILATGYPFNTDNIDLAVDSNDRVPIDKKYLKIKVPDVRYSWRDLDGTRYIYDLDLRQFHDQALPNLDVVFDIADIADLPELFARWIAQRAAETFFMECNAGLSNGALEQRRKHAQAVAINSLPTDININTGAQTARAGSGFFGSAVRLDGHWIYLA